MKLRPTFWRTCRVLASPRRLRLLGELCRCGPLNVGMASELTDLPVTTVSQCLRALQSRGLVSRQKTGRYVRYWATANPDVMHAGAVLRRLRPLLVTRERPDPAFLGDLAFAFTAFTHPRRIAVVRFLAESGACDTHRISSGTGIPAQSLWLHIDKLLRRGFVEVDKGPVYRLAEVEDALRAVLLEEALR